MNKVLLLFGLFGFFNQYLANTLPSDNQQFCVFLNTKNDKLNFRIRLGGDGLRKEFILDFRLSILDPTILTRLNNSKQTDMLQVLQDPAFKLDYVTISLRLWDSSPTELFEYKILNPQISYVHEFIIKFSPYRQDTSFSTVSDSSVVSFLKSLGCNFKRKTYGSSSAIY